MFNLLVKSREWAAGRDTIPAGRVFEHTEQHLENQFKPDGRLDFDSLVKLPTLFVKETFQDDPIVHVGQITRAILSGSDISLEYVFDNSYPTLKNSALHGFATEIAMVDWEFSRTHWAIKDIDLFRVLFRNVQPRRQQPSVFQINDPECIESDLISAMMPFNPGFNDVYAMLKDTAGDAGFRCQRADDIWINPSVIQDVVSLIDRSSIVICDCTGRNPNVFYEIGIAHTLGREVVLITQNEADIPFDLSHLRYVKYLNNGEGLDELKSRLLPRLTDLAER
jgi:hypothetical protein